jgi:hypothetical protein
MSCAVERFFPNPAWNPTMHEFIDIESFPVIPDLFTHLPVKEDAATSARNAAAFSELTDRGIDVGAFTMVSAGFMRPDLLADPEFSAKVENAKQTLGAELVKAIRRTSLVVTPTRPDAGER